MNFNRISVVIGCAILGTSLNLWAQPKKDDVAGSGGNPYGYQYHPPQYPQYPQYQREQSSNYRQNATVPFASCSGGIRVLERNGSRLSESQRETSINFNNNGAASSGSIRLVDDHMIGSTHLGELHWETYREDGRARMRLWIVDAAGGQATPPFVVRASADLSGRRWADNIVLRRSGGTTTIRLTGSCSVG